MTERQGRFFFLGLVAFAFVVLCACALVNDSNRRASGVEYVRLRLGESR